MRVFAAIALIGSVSAIRYIDNNLYAKMTGRRDSKYTDNAGMLAYDEIYSLSEEKEQHKEYANAVNTINERKRKAAEEKRRKEEEIRNKAQKEQEEAEKIARKQLEEENEKRGINPYRGGSFFVNSMPSIETTTFN